LREISNLSEENLAGKIFTFQKNLTLNDKTKMLTDTNNIDKIIKNLQCMKGIDEEFIPKFKFFKINKSIVKSSINL
jgi:hypothetical protein